eukprot:SAG22_NODE_617_length_8527_cov_70.297342_5_plen_88_part_00
MLYRCCRLRSDESRSVAMPTPAMHGPRGIDIIAAVALAVAGLPTAAGHGQLTHPPTRFPNAGPEFSGLFPFGSSFCACAPRSVLVHV